MINIEELKKQYQPDTSIFREDDNKMNRLKHIVMRLDETSKRIMLLYAELQSQRKVAEMLGISTSLVNQKIRNIRRRIRHEYYS